MTSTTSSGEGASAQPHRCEPTRHNVDALLEAAKAVFAEAGPDT